MFIAASLALLLSALPAMSQTTAADHTFARSGMSNTVAWWARPGRTSKHAPGIVGGSKTLGGEGPFLPAQGVFGYDYVGFGLYRRVFLGWRHSPFAPPPGPYQIDGPQFYDPLSIRPVRRALANGEGMSER
jgi:hypothetical protein